jgi:hypothetical protein
MSVDGVVKNIEPGVYAGEVVLSVTADYIVGFMVGSPFGAEHKFRMGIYIDDGTFVQDKSVQAAVNGVVYDDASASGGLIESNADLFNGIVVDGTSNYSIDDLTLMSTGNGGNDFAGYGAGIMSTGQSKVTVSNAFLSTDGVLSPALIGCSESTLTVKDSTVIAGNEPTNAGVNAPFMVEVPWLLGIHGNTRATNVLDSSKVTYENCYIEARSWGALSTDMCTPGASLNVIDSEIVVTESGYGAYADLEVFDTFTNCTFRVPDYGVIVAGGPASAMLNGGTVVNSKRFGIMWHLNQGGTVTVPP